ncbi:MAG: hypothetical protein B6226_04605, partial [Candidatus Cloacimonetes bacterium 4572_65]
MVKEADISTGLFGVSNNYAINSLATVYLGNEGLSAEHDPVYTSGEIRCSQTIPYEQVFQGGYFENMPEIEYPATADLARTGNNIDVGEDDILYVEVEGSSFDTYYGTRIVSQIDTIIIYDIGFDGDNTDLTPEDSIDVQYLIHKDTIWSVGGGGGCSNNSVFVKGELWLRGSFGGRQTWASQDTMYLTGDILLSGTEKGDNPDGRDGPMNGSDMVGLISEKSIIIQYGFRHPEDSVRYKYNCALYEDEEGDEDDGGIYIYAAMCALGEGEDTMTDGT